MVSGECAAYYTWYEWVPSFLTRTVVRLGRMKAFPAAVGGGRGRCWGWQGQVLEFELEVILEVLLLLECVVFCIVCMSPRFCNVRDKESTCVRLCCRESHGDRLNKHQS